MAHLTVEVVYRGIFQKNLAARKFFERVGTGSSALQATRPQTLGYGLADSPMGQCCWIVEKFWDWTDSAGPPENVISRNQTRTGPGVPLGASRCCSESVTRRASVR